MVAVVALALAFTALGVLLLLTGGDALRIG
jgi:hypothetical protein